MSGISAWLWGTSQLDDAVDKATSELLPAGSEDIALNLEICDQIRSKSVPAKDAMRALKRRLNHKNPNVQLLALGLTDTCIKNGGDQFLAEAASREFMDNLVSILKIPGLNHEVKNTILRLIQNWSVAFEGKYSLAYVGQVYKTLQGEGYKFPPKDLAVANSAMVDTQTAPEWIDSDVCLRCRTAFSFTNRKHHCRNCGQVFDQQCSSKILPLPHFGIAQEVRVCDGCYTKLTRKAERDKTDKRHRSTGSLHNNSRHQNPQALADAELQRAIELSLQETNSSRGYVPSQRASHWQPSEPPLVDRGAYSNRKMPIDDDDDPELKAAIEASLREANAPRPSAPAALDVPKAEEPPVTYDSHHSQPYTPAPALSQPPLPKLPNYDLDPLETDAILTFSQTVEQVQANGGRDLSRYPAVTELYDKSNSLRPKLALSLDDAGRKEQMLSEMHGKLSQAVKLYDQILTEQVTHPRWRTPLAQQYQPTPSSHNHDQWAPTSQTPTPQAVHPHPQTPAPQVAVQYHPTPLQYTAPPQQATRVPAQPQQTSEYTSGQTHYGQPIQQYFPPQTPGRQGSLPSPMPQQLQGIPLSPAVHTNASTSSYAPPSTTIMTPVPPVQSPPPPPVLQSRSPPFGYSSPAHSGTPSLPHVPAQNLSLGRSNTIAHPGFQQRATPQQQHPSNQTTSTLPQFPSVPTTAPVYDASIRNGVVRSEERKEALLIDL